MSCFGNSFFYLIIYLKRAMADLDPSPPVSASDNQSLAVKIVFSCLTIQCSVYLNQEANPDQILSKRTISYSYNRQPSSVTVISANGSIFSPKISPSVLVS